MTMMKAISSTKVIDPGGGDRVRVRVAVRVAVRGTVSLELGLGVQ
jgi:hypothetical protein